MLMTSSDLQWSQLSWTNP